MGSAEDKKATDAYHLTNVLQMPLRSRQSGDSRKKSNSKNYVSLEEHSFLIMHPHTNTCKPVNPKKHSCSGRCPLCHFTHINPVKVGTKGEGDGPSNPANDKSCPPSDDKDKDKRPDKVDKDTNDPAPSNPAKKDPPDPKKPDDDCPPEHVVFDFINDTCTMNFIIALFILAVSGCVFGMVFCRGSSSIWSCIASIGSGCCDLNPSLVNFFVRNKDKANATSGGGGSIMIPLHLQDQYEAFQRAAKDSGCLSQFGDRCPNIINYAGSMAGGSILTIRETETFPHGHCRCQDSGDEVFGKLCTPDDGKCSNCQCEKIGPETIIKEEELLVRGKCWTFTGKGKALIGLFFPILVTGVTIHHPRKTQLLPGYFSSAPKDFEVWGYHNRDDPAPYDFGKFMYLEDSTPTQTFEVQHLTLVRYANVQFNFLTNYGNPNYTAVYRVEVHGLMDRNSDNPIAGSPDANCAKDTNVNNS